MQIKFSHDYPKLHGQKSAKLVHVETIGRDELSPKFIEYDTVYDGGRYKLNPGIYLVLTFIGNDRIPFTTVRRHTMEKCEYYCNAMHKTFDVAIDNGETK